MYNTSISKQYTYNNICIQETNSHIFGLLDGDNAEGTEGDGTCLLDIVGQASSQQLIPPTVFNHHLLLIYNKNTKNNAPTPAIAPSRVLPSAPENKNSNVKCSIKNRLSRNKLC